MTKSQMYARAFRAKAKREVFEHYCNGTPKCASCGITDIRILTLDHVESNGAEQRKKLMGSKFRGGHLYYAKLRAMGYKETGLQVLCHNCHHLVEADRRDVKMLMYASLEPDKLPSHVITYPILDMLLQGVKTTEIQDKICNQYECSRRTARRWIYAIKSQILPKPVD